jgi:hypothetical protein
MKKIILSIAFPLALASGYHTLTFGQVIYSGGAGLSLNAVSVNAFAEAGIRIGSVCYAGGQVAVRQSGYPALSVGGILGAAHSWNNNKMHELTTIFYAKADRPIIYNDGYKSKPPIPFGFGIRHYVYNAMFDLSYSHAQVQFTIGYSLRDIYR